MINLYIHIYLVNKYILFLVAILLYNMVFYCVCLCANMSVCECRCAHGDQKVSPSTLVSVLMLCGCMYSAS